MSAVCEEFAKEAQGLKLGIADRAIWFHLLVQAAEKQNADIEALTDDAIFTYGVNLYKDRRAETAADFLDHMTEPGPGRVAFDQEVILHEDDHAVAYFHACPLVEAWRNYGLSEERIRYLCDLASKGDFGRASNFPHLEISFPQKIAHGDSVCELNVVRRK